ncbi:hypothetical protein XBFM1_740003 [Xenorhabdus bovienii str. feltiae Moldova]|uniref:Uncharacterized protein n=1 Tax=Xenorhabdus bovienii str. feltiae Moldova TaxID=1398200 RepID=A0A077NXV3_XENBV|nr:hypothetical protein XBFM1_740003 [Xenorhabdus bovienii str. feltiae Moldova]
MPAGWLANNGMWTSPYFEGCSNYSYYFWSELLEDRASTCMVALAVFSRP